MRTWLTEEPIDPASVLGEIGADEHGAAVVFLGVVRDHNDGRSVSGVEYSAYTEMAERVLAAIARETGERWSTDRIAAVHRVGALGIGETSVAIAVSTPHRAEAFEACRFIIEQLKQRLPVWKREAYVDGESEWVGVSDMAQREPASG